MAGEGILWPIDRSSGCPLGDHAFPDMPFTASNTPQCSPPDVRRPVENAGPDMPFTASSTLQCPEYTPLAIPIP
jgi:hypothetical protein